MVFIASHHTLPLKGRGWKVKEKEKKNRGKKQNRLLRIAPETSQLHNDFALRNLSVNLPSPTIRSPYQIELLIGVTSTTPQEIHEP